MSGHEVSGVREIKVYDDSRQPRDWHLLLGPSQCAVFFTLAASQTPVSSDGIPFRRFRDVTFFLFDSLAAARAYCEATLERHPDLCGEIYDMAGKAEPPLLRIVAPRVAPLDGGGLPPARKRQWIAVALLLAAFPAIWWDWRSGGWLVLPTFIGITMIVAAFRLFFWNLISKGRAARDQARLQSYLERERQHGANARTHGQPGQAP